MKHGTALVWFRQDLRLDDNSALLAALQRGGSIVPVFVWSPEEEGAWPLGAASRWWLHQSLTKLRHELRALGSDLVIRHGESLDALTHLGRECNADAIYWNRRYEPAVVLRDAAIKSRLRDLGWTANSFNGQLLFEPWEVATKAEKPFQVFTAFWKACLSRPEPAAPEPPPSRLPAPRSWPKSLSLESLELEPKIDWANGLHDTWQPGAAGAETRLREFLERGSIGYTTDRDRPDRSGTSSLSPHLHFGEIGPRRVWHAVKQFVGDSSSRTISDAETYLRELGWREFAHHLLFHFPNTTDEPLRSEFASFPSRNGATELRAWQRGRTGYPLVDAGMRQLWATGWMHNRVRMVTASFLVKHLLRSWQSGARWFWDTLVDADLANNTLGWQWTAGCGADAAPYFRIFNPIIQSEKFDPSGDYVRRWVPELARLPCPWIHRPWTASPSILADSGVELGRTYPEPIVEHAEARQRALQAFADMKDRVRS